MKKNVSAAAVMVALAGTMMFTSCSNIDMYDANVVNQNTVKSYEQQFVEAFGPVSETQSWDFTTSAKASTRGEASNGAEWERINHPNNFNSFVNGDFEEVKKKVESTTAQPWKPYAFMKIHPIYSKGNTEVSTNVNNYFFYTIGINYDDVYQDWEKIQVNAKYNYWYKGGTSLNFDSGRQIDTRNMRNDDSFFWYAIATPSNKDAAGAAVYNEVWSNLDQHKLETCKLFTVNNRQYVAFDCDGNKDYSDLICLLEAYDVPEDPVTLVKEVSKRYFMEDMGSIGDFDFNDCVVDLTQKEWSNGKLETYGVVRALGGTMDLTILIGGKPVWTKSEQEGLEFSKMYNTTKGDIDLNMNYGIFETTDWLPAKNNISLKVKAGDAQELDKDVVIDFPETGAIPQMVAVKTTKMWSEEKVRVPSISWFSAE